jgi:hypothetical protein
MMPNVMRRLLEIFLAFRFPGSGSVIGKLEEACKEHDKLDKYRLFALERLVQLESHSDNHDDTVSFSAMTFEQSRDACAALIEFMEIVDRPHLDGLRKLCAKP